MSSAIERVIDRQQALLAALDARDAGAIEAATAALTAALTALRAPGALQADAAALTQLDHARKQSEAARIRINVLSDWNRQRIDRLAELRGGAGGQVYSKPAISRHA